MKKTNNPAEPIEFDPLNLISIPMACLHTPLFLSGKNFGLKLEENKPQGLTLQYHWPSGRLLVGWNGKLAIVSESNIANVNVEDPKQISVIVGVDVVIPKSTYQKPMVVTAGPVPMHANAPRTAQVSDPSRGMK